MSSSGRTGPVPGRRLARDLSRVLGIGTDRQLAKVLEDLRQAVKSNPGASQFVARLPDFFAAVSHGYQQLEREVERKSHLHSASADELLAHSDCLRVAAEEVIMRCEEHFKAMMATLPGCAIRIDARDLTCVEFASQGVLALTGYAAEDLTARAVHLKDLIHPDDFTAVKSAVDQALLSRQSFSVCFRVVRRDGGLQWAQSVGQGLFDEFGHLRSIEGFVLDNTRAMAAQQEAAQLRGILSRALNCIEAGFALYDASDVLIECNAAFKKLYPDMATMLVPGMPYTQFLRALYSSSVRGLGTNKLSERDWIEKLLRLRRLGRPTEMKVNDRWILFHDHTTPEGLVVSLRTDITYIKTLNLQLKHALIEAESASKAKTEFLANVSHEMRTPMNGILGMTEMVLGTRLSPDQEQLAQTAKQAALTLKVLIDNILDFANLESGLVSLAPRNCSLRGVVHDCVGSVLSKANAKGLKVQLSVEDDVVDAVQADEPRLHQIITNLLTNAVNHSDAGVVSLSVTGTGGGDPGMQVIQIVVKDQGVGIPPEQERQIYSPFSQADNSSTRTRGGLGLGLAISKRIVQMMGGRIWHESRPQVGSTFHVEVPLLQTPQSPDLQGGAVGCTPCVARKRVLIAEDNAINELLIVEQVRMLGHEPTVVRNGAEAVRRSAEERFDLVLMDIQMPVMDGLTAAGHIRTRERKVGGYLPIVAVTANGTRVDQEKSFLVGMDGHLTKPVEVQRLAGEIDRVTRALPRQEATRSAGVLKTDLDFEAVLQWLGGDVALATTLVSGFISEAAAAIERICESVRNGRMDAAIDFCAKLSGESRKVAAPGLASLSSKISGACTRGDAHHAAQLSSQLLGALDRVRDFVIAHQKVQASRGKTPSCQ